MNLEEFLKSKNRTQWVIDDHIGVYMRKSRINRYVLYGISGDGLDIASVDVESGYRGKGLWKKFFAELMTQDLSPYKYLFVENVINDKFVKWFVRNDWQRDPRFDVDRCYVKFLGDAHGTILSKQSREHNPCLLI